MPIYEYQCETCGSVFEKLQRFADSPLTVHENCGGPVHRLLTAPAFQFKGSGWYVTDYGRGGAKDPNGAEKAASEAKSDGSKADATASKTDSSSKGESSSKSESSTSSKSDSSKGEGSSSKGDSSKGESSKSDSSGSKSTSESSNTASNKS